jgi:hypothetical protein
LSWKQKLISFLLYENQIIKFHCNVTYSPIHRQAGVPITNIQLIVLTAPDLYKNISLAVLLGSNGNSYSFYGIGCVKYLHNIGTLGGKKRNIKNLESSDCRVPRTFSPVIVSSALVQNYPAYLSPNTLHSSNSGCTCLVQDDLSGLPKALRFIVDCIGC